MRLSTRTGSSYCSAVATALQYELPVLVLNLNNRYLGMVKQWQDMLYSGRHSQSYMESLPDFVRLAEAYGHVGIRISEPQELETKLAEALEQVGYTCSLPSTVTSTNTSRRWRTCSRASASFVSSSCGSLMRIPTWP